MTRLNWAKNWHGHTTWAKAIAENEMGAGVTLTPMSEKEVETAKLAGVEVRPTIYPSGEFRMARLGEKLRLIEIPAWPEPSFTVFVGGKKLAEISGPVEKLEAAVKKVKLPETEKPAKKVAEVVILRRRVKELEAELAGLKRAA